jgi:hypothetical protein
LGDKGDWIGPRPFRKRAKGKRHGTRNEKQREEERKRERKREKNQSLESPRNRLSCQLKCLRARISGTQQPIPGILRRCVGGGIPSRQHQQKWAHGRIFWSRNPFRGLFLTVAKDALFCTVLFLQH